MENIFVTTLTNEIESWKKAFPKRRLVRDVEYLKKQPADGAVFWLHMNEDRQEWMQSAVKKIQLRYPDNKIIVIANTPNHAESLFALNLGAVGYTHAYAPEKTLKEVRLVAQNGGIWLGNELLQQLIDVTTKLTNTTPEYSQAALDKLTKRERQVAIEAAKGLSNKEIARILSITERTVKAHLGKVFSRLEVKDRLHLALMLNQK